MRRKFGWFLFLCFITWTLICSFSPKFKKVELTVYQTKITGTRTAAGQFIWVRPYGNGFEICIENQKEGQLIAIVPSSAFVVYQNHALNERRELKSFEVYEWLRDHPVNSSMIAVDKGQVSDVILALTVEE